MPAGHCERRSIRVTAKSGEREQAFAGLRAPTSRRRSRALEPASAVAVVVIAVSGGGERGEPFYEDSAGVAAARAGLPRDARLLVFWKAAGGGDLRLQGGGEGGVVGGEGGGELLLEGVVGAD